jgi:hypothetical protein
LLTMSRRVSPCRLPPSPRLSANTLDQHPLLSRTLACRRPFHRREALHLALLHCSAVLVGCTSPPSPSPSPPPLERCPEAVGLTTEAKWHIGDGGDGECYMSFFDHPPVKHRPHAILPSRASPPHTSSFRERPTELIAAPDCAWLRPVPSPAPNRVVGPAQMLLFCLFVMIGGTAAWIFTCLRPKPPDKGGGDELTRSRSA